jgi:ribosomal protein S18 acetylase RimI-like enzyme
LEQTIFRIAQRDDLRELADWLVQLSQVPEQHCLHTWSGQTPADLHRQLLEYWDASELRYVLARRDGQLVGAMGSELDEELGRGWLHGPHAALGDWDALAAALFTRLLTALPASIDQLDTYLNVTNRRGRRFYVRQGFEEREQRGYDFLLTPETRTVAGDGGGVPLKAQHHASFKALFEALFPTAYYSAERIIDMTGRSHHVLVLAEGCEVQGFVVVSVAEGLSTGEIQFVGVRESCRRQGVGRRLLLSAVDTLLDRVGVSAISLNVSQDLAGAQRLYESVGFGLRYIGVGFRKALGIGGS